MLQSSKVALLALLLSNLQHTEVQTTNNPAMWVRAEKTDAFSGGKHSEFTLRGSFLTPPSKHTEDLPALILHCRESEHHNDKNVFGGSLLSAELLVGSVLNVMPQEFL